MRKKRKKQFTRRNVSLTKTLEAMERALRRPLTSKNRSDTLAILIKQEYARRFPNSTANVGSIEGAILSGDVGAEESSSTAPPASDPAASEGLEAGPKKDAPQAP